MLKLGPKISTSWLFSLRRSLQQITLSLVHYYVKVWKDRDVI